MKNLILKSKHQQITVAHILVKTMSEERIVTIETKLAYQEDTITQLNDVICQQQNQIDALERLTQQLLGRVRDLSDVATQSGGGFSSADERPPHY